MTEVRGATRSDVEALTSTVASAFADDPAWTFIVGSGNTAAVPDFVQALLLPRLERGTVWVADDAAAVAMWDRRPPTTAGDPDHDQQWAGFRSRVGEDVWNRLAAYDAAVESAAPSRPYWYLGVLATHPDAQGQGLATAVLDPGFRAAAADGWDCWLETSTTANKAFYARRGFSDSVPVEVPDGPATWWLRRPFDPA